MTQDAPLVHVIAVAHERLGELKVFVQCWLNQTRDNWRLTILHDGPNAAFDEIMESSSAQAPGRIPHRCTEERFNDYGHSLREIGLREAEGDFVLLTNADNYYIPRAIEYLSDAIAAKRGRPVDVVMFDMIHSHNSPGGRRLPSYSFFRVRYKRRAIGMGAAIVATPLAKQAGFADKSYAADASYFEAVARVRKTAGQRLVKVKVPRVLLVHN